MNKRAPNIRAAVSPTSPGDLRPLHAAIQLLAVFAVSVVLVFLSHEFTRQAGRVASIWPLNAVLLAILMQQPASRWAAILATAAVGNLGVNAALGDSMLVGPFLTGANVVEVLTCAILLRRPDHHFDITRTSDLLRFVAVAGGFAPAVSATIAATALASSQPFLGTFGMWFAADALGMLVFAPAFLVLGAMPRSWPKIRAKVFEIGFSAMVLLAALIVVFWQTKYPLLFLIPPALTLATFRLGIGGAASGILLTCIVSIAFTVMGHGPTQLVHGSDIERAIVLQAFLAIMSLATLPVAASIAQSSRLQADLRDARERALESEAHYRTLADYSTDIVLRFGRGGVISYASPACRTLGYAPEDVVGRKTSDFAAAEDRAFSMQTTEALFAGPEPDRSIRREVRVPRPDGSVIWLEGSPNIIRNAAGEPVEVVSTFRDVTVRRELEDALIEARNQSDAAAAAARESEARYRTMSDISLDMIARMDMDGTIRFVSPSCRVVLGYEPGELLGQTTLQHTHPDELHGIGKFFHQLIAQGPEAPPTPYRFRAYRKDGVCIWLEGIPRILFDGDGNPIEIQDSVRDVTRRTELEQELSEARIAAEIAGNAKADFLANMSHELRTPLNSIIGFSRLLAKSTALTATDSRHVNLIASSSEGLLTIVNDILDFSSLEGAGIRLEALPFSVARSVRRCVEGLRVQADAKNLQLTFDVDDTVASAHAGDAARLNQVLVNLVGNAIKFTGDGSVHVHVSADGESFYGQSLRFEVRDTGIGIPADRRDALFARFSQIDSSINRRFGGTGLGLAISKHLVDLMDGEIGVESQEGDGATFWFRIVLPVAEATSALETEDGHRATSAGEGAKHILIVDDVDLNRELALAYLADSGHRIDVAGDGEEAVALARTHPYDLIFMDVQMPHMDGLAATQAIRATPGLQSVPIVAMTAQALPAQIAACRKVGMNDHLAKPIAPDRLEAMIQKWTSATASSPANIGPSDVMNDLRERFVARSRQDRIQLAALLAAAGGSEAEEVSALIHRFAGTAGTFGYTDLGALAASLDEAFAGGGTPTSEDFAPFLTALDALLQAA